MKSAQFTHSQVRILPVENSFFSFLKNLGIPVSENLPRTLKIEALDAEFFCQRNKVLLHYHLYRAEAITSGPFCLALLFRNESVNRTNCTIFHIFSNS